jgi:hypothetical protein
MSIKQGRVLSSWRKSWLPAFLIVARLLSFGIGGGGFLYIL